MTRFVMQFRGGVLGAQGCGLHEAQNEANHWCHYLLKVTNRAQGIKNELQEWSLYNHVQHTDGAATRSLCFSDIPDG